MVGSPVIPTGSPEEQLLPSGPSWCSVLPLQCLKSSSSQTCLISASAITWNEDTLVPCCTKSALLPFTLRLLVPRRQTGIARPEVSPPKSPGVASRASCCPTAEFQAAGARWCQARRRCQVDECLWNSGLDATETKPSMPDPLPPHRRPGVNQPLHISQVRPLPIFVDNILLEQSHTQLLM